MFFETTEDITLFANIFGTLLVAVFGPYFALTAGWIGLAEGRIQWARLITGYVLCFIFVAPYFTTAHMDAASAHTFADIGRAFVAALPWIFLASTMYTGFWYLIGWLTGEFEDLLIPP